MIVPKNGRSDHRSDRGVTVLFFAFALVAMLTVSALVLGGSIGYTAVRNAQTAADAGALAGASALQTHKSNWLTNRGGVSADDLAEEVETVVEDNGAELVGCDLVNANYAISNADADVIATGCGGLDILSQESFVQVAGVRVEVRDTREVPFAAFVDDADISGSARAAATVQPMRALRAPFLLCGMADWEDPNMGEPPIEAVPDTSPTEYRVNRAAINTHYVLWGNAVKEHGRDCRGDVGPAKWRGLGNTSFVGNIGGWWRTANGNKTGQLESRTNGVGTCNFNEANLQNDASALVGCTVPVPICPESNATNSDFQLRCTTIALFEISHAKGSTTTDKSLCAPDAPNDNVICGKLLDTAVATHGRGVAQVFDNQVVVIKLVQ